MTCEVIGSPSCKSKTSEYWDHGRGVFSFGCCCNKGVSSSTGVSVAVITAQKRYLVARASAKEPSLLAQQVKESKEGRMPREKRGVGGEDEAMRKRRSATLRSASNLKKSLNCPQPTAYVSCWAGESPGEKVSSNPDFSTVMWYVSQRKDISADRYAKLPSSWYCFWEATERTAEAGRGRGDLCKSTCNSYTNLYGTNNQWLPKVTDYHYGPLAATCCMCAPSRWQWAEIYASDRDPALLFGLRTDAENLEKRTYTSAGMKSPQFIICSLDFLLQLAPTSDTRGGTQARGFAEVFRTLKKRLSKSLDGRIQNQSEPMTDPLLKSLWNPFPYLAPWEPYVPHVRRHTTMIIRIIWHLGRDPYLQYSWELFLSLVHAVD